MHNETNQFACGIRHTPSMKLTDLYACTLLLFIPLVHVIYTGISRQLAAQQTSGGELLIMVQKPYQESREEIETDSSIVRIRDQPSSATRMSNSLKRRMQLHDDSQLPSIEELNSPQLQREDNCPPHRELHTSHGYCRVSETPGEESRVHRTPDFATKDEHTSLHQHVFPCCPRKGHTKLRRNSSSASKRSSGYASEGGGDDGEYDDDDDDDSTTEQEYCEKFGHLLSLSQRYTYRLYLHYAAFYIHL